MTARIDGNTVMVCARVARVAKELAEDVKAAGGQGDLEVGVALVMIGVSKLAQARAPDVEELFRELWEDARAEELSDGQKERGSRS